MYPDANSKDNMIASTARGKKQKMGEENRNGETSIDEFVSAFKWFLFVLAIACRNQLQPLLEEIPFSMSVTCSRPVSTPAHLISVSRLPVVLSEDPSSAGRMKESFQLLGSLSQSTCRLGWPEDTAKLLFVHTCVSAHTHTRMFTLQIKASSYL